MCSSYRLLVAGTLLLTNAGRRQVKMVIFRRLLFVTQFRGSVVGCVHPVERVHDD